MDKMLAVDPQKEKTNFKLGSIFRLIFLFVIFAIGFVEGGLLILVPILFFLAICLLASLIVSIARWQWRDLLIKFIVWGEQFVLGY